MRFIYLLFFFIVSFFSLSCNEQHISSSVVVPTVEVIDDTTSDNNTTGEVIDDTTSDNNTTGEVIDDTLINTTKLYWPIDCIPGQNCTIGHADINSDGLAFDCSKPGYTGHEGIDISISWEQMDEGVNVYAAQSGTVLWAFDNPSAYDRCIANDKHQDCKAPSSGLEPNLNDGYAVCTELGNYCRKDSGYSQCFWCFYGKNIVVIRHDTGSVEFTRYDHLKSGSILIKEGDYVSRGQKIAEVGSAGHSTGPHLHFEVWLNDYYDLAEPFSGECGPNYNNSLWNYENTPWKINTE